MANHRIGNISIALNTDQKKDAWRLQQHLKQLLVHSVVPKLEGIFDQLDQDASLLWIDQLEIDLGQMGRDELDQEFVNRLVEQVVKQIREVRREELQATRSLRISKEEAIGKGMLAFLLQGIIPTHFRSIFEEASEAEILEALSLYPGILERLIHLLMHSETAVQRLRFQFSQFFVQTLKESVEQWEKRNQASPLVSRSLTQLAGGKILDRKENERAREATKDKFIGEEHIGKEVVALSLGEINEEQKGQYVRNAGLVMVHPYLSGDNETGFSLFEEMGLTKEGLFLNESTQERALHILQYLVWGKEQQPEHKMVLEKIMCGFPLGKPVHRFISLKQEEKAACEKLARLLTNEWAGMVGTSLDALQESFLQRLGKLTPITLGWKLIIEKNTLDILLKKLPFGMGILRLPWMDQMLWVEWDY